MQWLKQQQQQQQQQQKQQGLVRSVVVSGVFSPVNPSQEEWFAKELLQAWKDTGKGRGGGGCCCGGGGVGPLGGGGGEGGGRLRKALQWLGKELMQAWKETGKKEEKRIWEWEGKLGLQCRNWGLVLKLHGLRFRVGGNRQGET